MVETSVSYDFDGDGTMDRVEHFQPQGVPEEPDPDSRSRAAVLGRGQRVVASRPRVLDRRHERAREA